MGTDTDARGCVVGMETGMESGSDESAVSGALALPFRFARDAAAPVAADSRKKANTARITALRLQTWTPPKNTAAKAVRPINTHAFILIRDSAYLFAF